MADNQIRKFTNAFIAWCGDDSPAARLERTVVQGIIGVGIAVLSSFVGAPEWVQMVIIPLVMAILAPLQAAIGGDIK